MSNDFVVDPKVIVACVDTGYKWLAEDGNEYIDFKTCNEFWEHADALHLTLVEMRKLYWLRFWHILKDDGSNLIEALNKIRMGSWKNYSHDNEA